MTRGILWPDEAGRIAARAAWRNGDPLDDASRRDMLASALASMMVAMKQAGANQTQVADARERFNTAFAERWYDYTCEDEAE